MKKTSSVEDYIATNNTWKNELEVLRNIMLKTILEETIKWGAPVYTINNKNVVGLAAFKHYVGLWFFNGVLLNDPKNVLINAQEGKTKAMRQWRFGHANEIDETLIVSYVEEAIANQEAGKVIKPSVNSIWTVPVELTEALKKDQKLYYAYYNLSLYKQKEYAEYISEAKQQATKEKRLQKIVPMILNGIGLNDKYR